MTKKQFIKLFRENPEDMLGSDWKNELETMKVLAKGQCDEHFNPISFTCCNIEVNEPAGTEVMCPECKEWVTTKSE